MFEQMQESIIEQLKKEYLSDREIDQLLDSLLEIKEILKKLKES